MHVTTIVNFCQEYAWFDYVRYIIYNKFEGDFNMSEYCYLVHEVENYGDSHVILAIFKDKIKAEMDSRNVQEVNAGMFKIKYQLITSERFDSKRFREENYNA